MPVLSGAGGGRAAAWQANACCTSLVSSIVSRHRSTLLAAAWVCAQEEMYKARLGALKREEEGVKQELTRLEGEKVAYIR